MNKDEEYKSRYPETYNTAYNMLRNAATNNPDRGVSVVAIYTQIKGINRCATIKKMLDEVSWARYSKSKYYLATDGTKSEFCPEDDIKEKMSAKKIKKNDLEKPIKKNKKGIYVLNENIKLDKVKVEPLKITYFGRELPNVGTWKELYARLINVLVQDFPNRLPIRTSFDENKKGCDMCREDDVQCLREPRRLLKGYYIETDLSDTEIINKIIAIIKLCSLKSDDVIIEYKYVEDIVINKNENSEDEISDLLDRLTQESYTKFKNSFEKMDLNKMLDDKKDDSEDFVKNKTEDIKINEKDITENSVISIIDVDENKEKIIIDSASGENIEGELNKRPIVQIDDVNGEDYFTICVSDDDVNKKYYLYDSEGNQIVFNKKNLYNLQQAVNKELISERPKTSLFTQEELLFIEEQWTEICCNLKDIQNNYKLRFNKNISGKITERNLASIGYRVLGNFIVVHEEIKDIDELIARLFDKKKTVDFSGLEWLLKNYAFNGRFNLYKKDYSYIEFDTNKYVNIHMLRSDGLSKKIIADYCNKVIEFVHGRIFTLKSLRKHGFTHELEEFGFENCFYESILNMCDKLKHSRHKGQYIFKDAKGTGCNYGILINEIILDRGSMDIYDLLTVLDEEYGIKMAWYDARNAGVEEGLYYSDTMEKLYLDYDDFYEEV